MNDHLVSAVLYRSLAILLLCNLSACIGQDHSPITESTLLSTLPVGIPIADNILALFVDSRGHLWIGTSDRGVARYDGHELIYISVADGLCGETVEDITEDADGVMWFGTYADMCRYDPGAEEEGAPVAFIHFERSDTIPLLGYGWKNVVRDHSGKIWVNTHRGIYQYVDGIFEPFSMQTNIPQGTPSFCSTPGVVSMDLQDSRGHWWFGTDGDGVYRYDGSSYTHWTVADGLASNSVTAITEDHRGRIWMTCRPAQAGVDAAAGVSCIQGDAILSIEGMPDFEGLTMHTIYCDRGGAMWIGAAGRGIYRYDGVDFTFYPEPMSVRKGLGVYVDGLQSICQDAKGQIWLGYSGGLYRILDDEIVHVTADGPWD